MDRLYLGRWDIRWLGYEGGGLEVGYWVLCGWVTALGVGYEVEVGCWVLCGWVTALGVGYEVDGYLVGG